MWLSKQASLQPEQDTLAQFGTVSIPGPPVSVFLSGERRNVAVMAPGGYYWKPLSGDSVLVLGCEAEDGLCLLGREISPQAPRMQELAPGELFLSVAPTAGIHLRLDGSIHLIGTIFTNGVQISPPPEESDGGGQA